MPQGAAPQAHAGRLRHSHYSYSAAGEYKDI